MYQIGFDIFNDNRLELILTRHCWSIPVVSMCSLRWEKSQLFWQNWQTEPALSDVHEIEIERRAKLKYWKYWKYCFNQKTYTIFPASVNIEIGTTTEEISVQSLEDVKALDKLQVKKGSGPVQFFPESDQYRRKKKKLIFLWPSWKKLETI